ncbi:MAG: hypothetical protein ACPGSC_14760, partial [Granulosicoccaceae bacterium]
MASVLASMTSTGPSMFQDKATLDKYIKRFGQFTDAIKRYNSFEHEVVLAARQEYLSLRQALSDEHTRAKNQTAALGDIQSELKALEAKLHQQIAPNPLNAPFNAEMAKQWVKISVNAKTHAQTALSRLAEIEKTAALKNSEPGTVQQGARYDRQDINRLKRLSQGTVEGVDSAYNTTMANLKAQLGGVNNELEYFRKLDPNNEAHRANAFLKAGAAEEIHSRLDAHLKVAESAAFFMQAFGKAPSPGLQTRIDEIKQLKTNYDVQREAAAGAYTLPPPASTDASLLAIANDIMSKPEYNFGKHGPIVLTTATLIDREREESEEKFTDVDVSLSGEISLSGTKTTWTYRWQEFKFATPILDDDGSWHVWWITAR